LKEFNSDKLISFNKLRILWRIKLKDCILFFRYGRWVTRRVAIGGIVVVWLLAGLISFVPISLDLHRNEDTPKSYNDAVEV